MLEAYKITWLKTFEWKRRMPKEIYGKGMTLHFLLSFFPCFIMAFLEMNNILACVWYCFFWITLFPVISSTIQRLHDVGKSGWYFLLCSSLGCITIGWILLFLQLQKSGMEQDNKWGSCEETLEQGEESRISFVDERLTLQDVRAERKKLFFVLLKIVGISIILVVVGFLLSTIEMLLAPYI